MKRRYVLLIRSSRAQGKLMLDCVSPERAAQLASVILLSHGLKMSSHHAALRALREGEFKTLGEQDVCTVSVIAQK